MVWRYGASVPPIFSGAVVGGSVFVLFVDGDAAFADAAARSFESVGMRTVVALGSMPALDVFDNHDIDVVVTDVKLPAGEHQGSALGACPSIKQILLAKDERVGFHLPHEQ